MSIRTVTKALAGKEDLLLGNEKHVQQRGANSVEVEGLSAEVIPMSGAASESISTAVYSRARVVDTIADLATLPTGQAAQVLGFHTKGDGGGGVFFYDDTEDKANHNGGTVIDPAKAGLVTDWTANQTEYFTAGTGTGAWKREYSGAVNVKWFGAVGDGITDDSVILQKVVDKFYSVFIPVGAYFVSNTIVIPTQRTIIGELPAKQLASPVSIVSSLGTLGENVPIFWLGGGSSTQSIMIKNIRFSGDNTSINWSDLSTSIDEGIVGIDPSGCKQGLHIVDCSFSKLKCGIKTIALNNYIGFTEVIGCKFNACYKCVDFSTSTGVNISNTTFYDCFTVGYLNQVIGDNVAFNNSSFSSEQSGLSFARGTFSNLWLEGYNRTLQPTQYLEVSSSYFSESFSLNGDSKYSIAVLNDNVTVILKGVRLATNTRFLYFGDVDFKTVSIYLLGCSNGSNFANVSAVDTYIELGLHYTGDNNSTETLNKSMNAPLTLPTYIDRQNSLSFQTLPSLLRKVYWTNSISFSLDFPTKTYESGGAQYSSSRHELFHVSVVGSSNGAGGTVAFFADIKIFNAYDTTWDYVIEGRDASSYTVTLSNKTRYGVDVLITELHGGSEDTLIFRGATSSGTIKFLS